MTEEKVLDKIVVLMRDGDGYFDHDRLSLSCLNNVVPIIGDRLTLHLGSDGLGVYQVINRYLTDLRPDDAEGGRFWVLIVDQIHEDQFFKLDDLLRAIYREEFDGVWPTSTRFPHRSLKTAENLDRSNRDPAYWTQERKELLRKEREARLAAIKSGTDDLP